MINKPDFKFLTDGRFSILAYSLRTLSSLDRATLDTLSGIGQGNSFDPEAWLVTLANTRTSHVFTKGEQIAPSYIAERLHVYEKTDCLMVSKLIQMLSGLILNNQSEVS